MALLSSGVGVPGDHAAAGAVGRPDIDRIAVPLVRYHVITDRGRCAVWRGPTFADSGAVTRAPPRVVGIRIRVGMTVQASTTLAELVIGQPCGSESLGGTTTAATATAPGPDATAEADLDLDEGAGTGPPGHQRGRFDSAPQQADLAHDIITDTHHVHVGGDADCKPSWRRSTGYTGTGIRWPKSTSSSTKRSPNSIRT